MTSVVTLWQGSFNIKAKRIISVNDKSYLMKAYLPFIVFVFSLVSCNRKSENQTESIKPVKYEKVSYFNHNKSHAFSGTVKAEHETNLSFKVGGTLSNVNIKIGDKVKKGQLLASINPVDYEVQKEQAVAQKMSAESQLVIANSTFSRVEKLYENNSVALSEYEKAKVNLASAESQFKAAGKQLEATQNQVAYTRLYAPFDGVITSLMVESNEIVGAGRMVAAISSVSHPEIMVGVPEVLIGKLQKGQAVSIQFPSIGNAQFTGKIKKLAFASGQSSTFPVTVSIANSPAELRPGMSAEVSFIMETGLADHPNKVMAPTAAVGKDGEGNFVFILKKDTDSLYLVEKRRVVIGQLLDDGFEIESGLVGDELVATAGLTFIRDGMQVKLLMEY